MGEGRGQGLPYLLWRVGPAFPRPARPATGAPRRPALPHAPSGHVYDPECALCTGDTNAIAAAIARTLSDVIAASSGQPNTLACQDTPQAPKQRRPPADTDGTP
ncbi:hypothetical protein ACR6C2_15015 [Streptomyces sp. INA 01156]